MVKLVVIPAYEPESRVNCAYHLYWIAGQARNDK